MHLDVQETFALRCLPFLNRIVAIHSTEAGNCQVFSFENLPGLRVCHLSPIFWLVNKKLLIIKIESQSEKRHNKMVDRIRWDSVSYLPFYYIFFSDWLSIFIINNFLFTSQNIGDKWHTLKPGESTVFGLLEGRIQHTHKFPIILIIGINVQLHNSAHFFNQARWLKDEINETVFFCTLMHPFGSQRRVFSTFDQNFDFKIRREH